MERELEGAVTYLVTKEVVTATILILVLKVQNILRAVRPKVKSVYP